MLPRLHWGLLFAEPASRLERPAVRVLVRLLTEDDELRAALRAFGFDR